MFTTPCCEHHYLLCDVHYCATDITTQFLQCENTCTHKVVHVNPISDMCMCVHVVHMHVLQDHDMCTCMYCRIMTCVHACTAGS